jgi:hypothetical protein
VILRAVIMIINFLQEFTLSLQQTATTHMLQVSSRQQPRLSEANFANTDIHAFIQHVHQLIRAEAFEENVMETLLDEESVCDHYNRNCSSNTNLLDSGLGCGNSILCELNINI